MTKQMQFPTGDRMKTMILKFFGMLAIFTASYALVNMDVSFSGFPLGPIVWLAFVHAIAVPLLQTLLIHCRLARPAPIAENAWIYLPLLIPVAVLAFSIAPDRSTGAYILGALYIPMVIWVYPQMTRLLVKLGVCRPDLPPETSTPMIPPATTVEIRPPPPRL